MLTAHVSHTQVYKISCLQCMRSRNEAAGSACLAAQNCPAWCRALLYSAKEPLTEAIQVHTAWCEYRAVRKVARILGKRLSELMECAMASTSCRCHGTSAYAYMPEPSQRLGSWGPEPWRINARQRRISAAAVADRSTALAEKGSEVCYGIPKLDVNVLHCASSPGSSSFALHAHFLACRAH